MNRKSPQNLTKNVAFSYHDCGGIPFYISRSIAVDFDSKLFFDENFVQGKLRETQTI